MNARMIHPIKEQRGVVLVVALLVLTVLSVLGLAFLTTARTEDTIAANYRNHTAAFYAAEAGVESGIASLKSLVGASPTPTDAQLASLVAPALTDPSYTFNAFQVRRVRTVQPYNYQTTITTGPYAGLMAQTTDYLVTATVTGPRGSRARLNQTIQYMQIPLFQFGLFYGRGVNLEVSPGPAMTFNGRVHSNSNLYLAAGTTLNFDSYVTTVGNVYRYQEMDPGDRQNNPQIKDASGVYRTLNFDHEYNHNFASAWAQPAWAAATDIFNGRLQDSAHGVQEIIPPIPATFYDPANPDVSAHQMIEKGSIFDAPELAAAKLYYQADLVIHTNTLGVTTARDKNGVPVDISGCNVTTKSFHDKREQANMTVTEINVGSLQACGKAPANGILYVSRDGTDQGVRLVNGAQLPAQGLTVVSENPVYVQGNYNNVNKVPAAVLADAITVLSNNWGPNNSDAKGNQVTSNRPATSTTVNAAFALGPDEESSVGQGNGQLENLIRFLEDWDGDTFTYNGSLIALWHSLQATGDWRCCGDSGNHYYRAPNRVWGYDTLFNTSIPPGTPRGILTLKGRWSQA